MTKREREKKTLILAGKIKNETKKRSGMKMRIIIYFDDQPKWGPDEVQKGAQIGGPRFVPTLAEVWSLMSS